MLTTYRLLAPRLRMSGLKPPVPHIVKMTWCSIKYRDSFPFRFVLVNTFPITLTFNFIQICEIFPSAVRESVFCGDANEIDTRVRYTQRRVVFPY